MTDIFKEIVLSIWLSEYLTYSAESICITFNKNK